MSEAIDLTAERVRTEAPGKGYVAILRLYGPTEAAIDKSWKPGDIEKQK